MRLCLCLCMCACVKTLTESLVVNDLETATASKVAVLSVSCSSPVGSARRLSELSVADVSVHLTPTSPFSANVPASTLVIDTLLSLHGSALPSSGAVLKSTTSISPSGGAWFRGFGVFRKQKQQPLPRTHPIAATALLHPCLLYWCKSVVELTIIALSEIFAHSLLCGPV